MPGPDQRPVILELLRITSPLHRDLRGGAIDLPEIVRREFDGECPDVDGRLDSTLMRHRTWSCSSCRHIARKLRIEKAGRDSPRSLSIVP
jgi:hypothetical protein